MKFREWMHRSRPGQVMWAFAAALLVLSVLVANVTGYYDKLDERNKGTNERTHLLIELGQLRGELRCRSHIGGVTATEELRLLNNLSRAFLTLGTDDEAEYNRVANDIRARQPFIERAIKARESAEADC